MYTMSSPSSQKWSATLAIVPLTHRSEGSLVSIMTCAPRLNTSSRSTGISNPSSCPVRIAEWCTAGSGICSSIPRLRDVAIRLVVVRVSQNSSMGGVKSGSVRALSSRRASSSSAPSRTALRMSTRRSSPS